ncbi:sugar phosphate isomerase/epimerase family protein [Heyndrickxia acidicola]|uniref:TIM barrel protein n=1 Tax=Heyndrickxia acidicola TaxID=209389 RepID=A0ABU6MCW9_9BACI|nr:TIM barrel protein [Heyndrickxia acidicola]MED1201523.1 TIM barrel protein [Heyndrickxia acidicola]
MVDVLITMNSFTAAEVSQEGYQSLFKMIKAAGFSGVEIRRELLKEELPSVSDIKTMLNDIGLVGYYSCPIPLFNLNGGLNTEQIKQALLEGQCLDAKLIKFSLGHYTPDSCMEDLRVLTETAIGRYCITVENDQTQEGGKVERLAAFFERCEKEAISIYFTCDIGNWLYVKEDPSAAIEKMKAHTKYIHIKEVVQAEDGFTTVAISPHTNFKWKRLQEGHSNATPIAVEFPVDTRSLKDYYSMITEGGAHYETV